MKSLLITKAFFIAAVSLARAGTMTDLGTLPGGNYSTAQGISPDGSVVVGYSNIAIYEGRAYRWTSAGGLESLGVLPGGSRSNAFGVSADGSVVVGYSESSSGERAFRWTAADGMQSLGTLSFSMPSADPTRDQARIGLDVDHKLDDLTTLSVTVHAAGVGESPDVSGALSLRRAF